MIKNRMVDGGGGGCDVLGGRGVDSTLTGTSRQHRQPLVVKSEGVRISTGVGLFGNAGWTGRPSTWCTALAYSHILKGSRLKGDNSCQLLVERARSESVKRAE